MMKYAAKRIPIRPFCVLLGRRNLARLGRVLSNEDRYDGPNNMRINGELLVQQRALAKKNTDGSMVVFDIGANVGNWTISLLRAAMDGEHTPTVHTFEPCEGTRMTLRCNLSGIESPGKVHVNAAALSSSETRSAFFSTGSNVGTNSLFTPRGTALSDQVVTEVQTQTVDGYCKSNGVAHIDLIKVDTEGNDLEVLHGARTMLSTRAIDIIQFEYNHRWIAARRYLRDAFDLFQPLGYQLGKVTPVGIEYYDAWDPEMETFREGNYVATAPGYEKLFSYVAWWNK